MRTSDEKLRELIAEQAAEWHVAHADGGLSPQEARAFMRWLRTSPVHVAEYLAIAAVARDACDASRRSTASLLDLAAREENPAQPLGTGHMLPASETAPLQVRRKLSTNRPRPVPRKTRTRWASVAAALLVVSLAALVGTHRSGWHADAQTFATERGEVRSLQLPDNTLVQLDSDSAIAIRFDGAQRRVVVERGQAFFKVFKDSARPFSVQVGDSVIRDIGTAFDVYRRAADTTVTVSEGRVQVWNGLPDEHSRLWWSWLRPSRDAGDAPVADLDAGKQVRIDNAGQVIALGAVDVQQALAWTSGRIAFDNEAVAAVAAEFNRYNNVQISVESASVGATPITGTFNVHDVGTFVAFLGTLPGVHAEERGDRIIVGSGQKKR